MLMHMSHLVWKTKVSLCVEDEGKPPPVDDEGMSDKGKQFHMDNEDKLPSLDGEGA